MELLLPKAFRAVLASGRANRMTRYQADVHVIGSNTRVTGRITGDGALRVEGDVKGDISVTGEAEIAEGGSVEGNFRAESLAIYGSLLGDAVVRGAISVRSGSIVRGELKGAEVSIEPGSRVSVRLDTAFDLPLASARRR